VNRLHKEEKWNQMAQESFGERDSKFIEMGLSRCPREDDGFKGHFAERSREADNA